jgi:hypothetical protein
LTNTLALISIIYEEQKGGSANATTLLDKLINYALVCIQIAYPYIYNQLTEEPDFKNWNDKIASKLKLRPLTEEEIERLNSTEEFDDDWEKVVFRMCQKETYLSNRVFSVSALLNKIAEIINDDEQLGEIIESTIEMSAVTNLKAFDTPKKLEAKFPWGEKVWEPVKASLAANNIALKAPKTSQNWIVFKLKSKDMLIVLAYNPGKNIATVQLETSGGDEIKSLIDSKIALTPEGHVLRNAETEQGKRNKNKWVWAIRKNIDKNSPEIIKWYADVMIDIYRAIEG